MAFQKAVKGTALIGGGAIATVFGLSQFSQYRNKHGTFVRVQAAEAVTVPIKNHFPTREQQILALQTTGEFDVLVIGGGATGCGCALDAVTRGLKTALLERDDFSSGTSSRSTKLIHGGVRYLQKAIMKLDFEQYKMVKEALEERANLLEIAPHLSAPLPIMLPVYKWWQLPYYWFGIKLYDLVAGSQCLKSSYVLSKSRALELFPMLRKDELVGAIVYYDGQHNDARMNLAIALTAARYGAATANYTEVLRLLKTTEAASGKERVCGVRCRDVLTGPGILTRTLLNAGVRVVALENNSAFLPNLQSLENSLDGQLKVIYGDFFRLDPLVTGTVKPPAMSSDKLFETIGVEAVPWSADVPVRVFGIIPQVKERIILWRLLFALYECSSIYKYGRVELNIFLSEKEYKVLTGKVGDVRAYQAISILWQVGCEIQLLHMEPWSSFLTNLKTKRLAVPKSMWLPNDHLCLVRLTPRQNLFTGGLKPTNSSTFIFMVKQCLAKPTSRLTDRLNSWSLDSDGKLLRELEIPENATTRHIYPEDYRRLFEALQNSNMFTETWFHDEVLESIRNINLQI